MAVGIVRGLGRGSGCAQTVGPGGLGRQSQPSCSRR